MDSVAQVSTGGLLAVALGLFAIGLVGVLVRRDLLFVLMSLEIMFTASALAFVVAAAKWGQPDGQVMVFLIVVAAAAEVGVGLSLVLRLYHGLPTVDSDEISSLRG